MSTFKERMMQGFLGVGKYPDLDWFGDWFLGDVYPDSVKEYRIQGNADAHFPVMGHYIHARQRRRAYENIRRPRELEVEKFKPVGDYPNEFARYNDAGTKVYEKNNEALRLWADNGQLIYEWVYNGKNQGLRTWNEQGQILFEQKADGSAKEWFEDGKKRSEWTPVMFVSGPSDCSYGHGYEWDHDGHVLIEHKGYDITQYDDKQRLILEQNYEGYKTYDYHGDSDVISDKHVFEGRFGHVLYREKLYDYQHFNEKGVEDTDDYLASRFLAERKAVKEDMKKVHDGRCRMLAQMSRVTDYAKKRVAKKYIKTKRAELKSWPKLSSERR